MIHENSCEDKKDEELVKLTLKDQDAYVCLIRRYEDKISRYIKRISSATEEDAEDILQEIFIDTYKNLNDFDSDLRFSSWIYRIAHNKTISFWRKNKNKPKTANSDDDLGLFNLIASNDDLVKDLERKCSAKEIKNMLEDMDEKYREILVLKFLEEKSYQEISDILKKPMGTVATLINRAKKQFRENAKKQGIEF